ncbi:MAG TPA: glycoside hydrolase domain-containing protein [Gemmatimonadaceae bacterium]
MLAASAVPLAAQSPAFTVAASRWDSERFGNHRAVVRVDASGRWVHVRVPWRRPDRGAATKAAIITTEAGAVVANVRRGTVTQAAGEFDFEPIAGAGRYFLYYLPYKSGGRSNYPNVKYLPVTNTADSTWLAALAAAGAVPTASVERFEAVDSLNSFAPMEVIATPDEVSRLDAASRDAAFVVFPEDRLHSIRMRDQLPLRWVERGSTARFADAARRGEFLAFQLGVWARRPLTNVHVTFSDLSGPGAVISASRLTSFNEGGINWDGARLRKRVDVAAGAVQAMWCGVDVPMDALPGIYRGTARVGAEGAAPVTIALAITVGRDSVLAGGANEPEKLTRLKWFNSTLGQRNDVIAPYTPIVVEGRVLKILGRSITLDASGLPAKIETFFTPEMTGVGAKPNAVIAEAVRLSVVQGHGAGCGAGAQARCGEGGTKIARALRFTRREPGTVSWEATTDGGAYEIAVRGTLEFDGFLNYEVRLQAKSELALDDVRLDLPYAKSAATYALGLGLKGQSRPASFDWTWDVARKNQDGAWLGGVNAGLMFSLRAENYVRPLNTNFYLQKPLLLPPSWGNEGKGTISWREDGNTVRVQAMSGARTLAAGDSLRFDVRFLITPFHALDTENQWARRFYHKFSPIDTVIAAGATVVNIHHANAINPWINYPFIAHDTMKAYIDAAHARGLKVKIYNTVRELSNHAYETFALRSFGHEVYSPGAGGGYSWLQEHLGDDYIAAWFVPDIRDAAVVNSGMSRWHNYYIEGINWLVKNVGIDGLYLDDVAFDRTTMKRVRRMLKQDGHPGIVDLHSANQYNERDGFINSAMLYMELFPFLDRLWFGEYFDYEKSSADFWMSEVSGIPFGLMGEMLEGGGNPWRGMVFGMTNRMPWSAQADPRPLWRLWDAFGIKGSTLLGWWAPSVPVTTGRDDVKATVFRRNGRALVAVASWAPTPVSVRMNVNWTALGIDPARARFYVPAVQGLQAAQELKPGDAIEIAPGKGIIFIIR